MDNEYPTEKLDYFWAIKEKDSFIWAILPPIMPRVQIINKM